MAETHQTYAEAMQLTEETVNDVVRILSMSQNKVDEIDHAVDSGGLTAFTWDYELSRPALVKLYEKAKTSQWNASTDLDWSIEVDQMKLAQENAATNLRAQMFRHYASADDTCPLYGWTDEQFDNLSVEFQNWALSQFMHGEQGALICTAKIVEQVPWIDAKYYGATQVMDEARHVEVFARYLNEKLSGHYPINIHLETLLDDIIRDSRWDMTYLGMQIMVEGLALAAFGLANVMFQDPIVKQITDLIMRDEARHVAFGVLSLQGIYEEMTSVEIREREDFVIEASTLMRDRFLLDDVWERMGIDVEEGKKFANEAFPMIAFRQMLFSKIVPNINKLGLLTDRVRPHFEALGVIQHEHNLDSATELDPSLVA